MTTTAKYTEPTYDGPPKATDPVRTLPEYPWLPDATLTAIEGFHSRRNDMLKTRANATDALEKCFDAVREGTFSSKTIKTGEKARADLLVADAMEIPLCVEWTRLNSQIQKDSSSARDAATDAIREREDEIEKDGIAAGEAEAVRDARIQTDQKIAEISEACPPQIGNDGNTVLALKARIERLQEGLKKHFTV